MTIFVSHPSGLRMSQNSEENNVGLRRWEEQENGENFVKKEYQQDATI